MAIVNTGFGAYPKVKCLEQSPQNFQFCVNIENEKIKNLAKCLIESSVLRNPVLTIAETLCVIGKKIKQRKNILRNMKEIEALIPHRYPFLFVDKIVSANENEIIGTMTFDKKKDIMLTGSFPKYDFIPGTIIVESMASKCSLK